MQLVILTRQTTIRVPDFQVRVGDFSLIDYPLLAAKEHMVSQRLDPRDIREAWWIDTCKACHRLIRVSGQTGKRSGGYLCVQCEAEVLQGLNL